MKDKDTAFLKEPLQQLKGQFDLKYWPSIADVVGIIANDAESAEVYALDSVTQANISSSRSSLTDYFKAFFQALEDEKEFNHQFDLGSFELSDDSLASVVNCALNLTDGEMKDGQYVKRLRQRLREQEVIAANVGI